MKIYAGIDVSLEASRICIVSADGKIVWEGRAMSDPEALGRALAEHGGGLERVGIEAGPLSEWLHDGLTAQGFAVVLLETRCLKGALSMLPVKSDRSDARGIAQAVRTGWYRAVHVKSLGARRVRALMRARRLIVDKRADVAGCLRGLLRAEGIKLARVSPARLAARVRALIAGQPLAAVIEPLIIAYEALRAQELAYDRMVYAAAGADPVCRLLATAPGVGGVVALTFRAVIDDPHRLSRSRQAGALLGLTPRRDQSGEVDRMGAISKAGDGELRKALYEAATILLGRVGRRCRLARWAESLAARRGIKRARVALARKLACVLVAMWKTMTPYRPELAIAA